jgi:hypothetical protein
LKACSKGVSVCDAELEKIAESGKPLYDILEDSPAPLWRSSPRRLQASRPSLALRHASRRTFSRI